MNIKTCVIGADGFLGKAFLQFYQKSQSEVFATSRSIKKGLVHLDLGYPEISDLLLHSGYTHAIITAGVTHIAECEAKKEKTYHKNVTGILAIVKALHQLKIQPILFSSDYVFDGKKGFYQETDVPSPLNEYGRQKMLLEQKALDITRGNCLIIRLNKVFDLSSQSLIGEMVERLKRGKSLYAARDQIFAPVSLDDVLNCTARLQQKGVCGVYHLCGSDTLSRYELAKRVAQQIGVNKTLIQPILLRDLGEKFLRPLRTDFNCEKIKQLIYYEINGLCRNYLNKLIF